MSTLVEYITVHWQTIAVYVATRPILNECRKGERKRGAVPHRWWWEQHMDLHVNDATGSVIGHGNGGKDIPIMAHLAKGQMLE